MKNRFEIGFNIYPEGSSYYIPNPSQTCYGIGKTIEESIDNAIESIPDDIDITSDTAKKQIIATIKEQGKDWNSEKDKSVCNDCDEKTDDDFDNENCNCCEFYFHCELFLRLNES